MPVADSPASQRVEVGRLVIPCLDDQRRLPARDVQVRKREICVRRQRGPQQCNEPVHARRMHRAVMDRDQFVAPHHSEPPAGRIVATCIQGDSIPIAEALRRRARNARAAHVSPAFQDALQVARLLRDARRHASACDDGSRGIRARSPRVMIDVRSRVYGATIRPAPTGDLRQMTRIPDLRRRSRRRAPARRPRPSHSPARGHAARSADRRTHPAQARNAAAHRIVQVPRRLEPAGATERSRARRRRRRIFVGQPCPGSRRSCTASRHPRDDRDAVRCATREAAEHAGHGRRDRRVRPGSRKSRADRGQLAAERGRDAGAVVRRPGHHCGPGHGGPRNRRAGG